MQVTLFDFTANLLKELLNHDLQRNVTPFSPKPRNNGISFASLVLINNIAKKQSTKLRYPWECRLLLLPWT